MRALLLSLLGLKWALLSLVRNDYGARTTICIYIIKNARCGISCIILETGDIIKYIQRKEIMKFEINKCSCRKSFAYLRLYRGSFTREWAWGKSHFIVRYNSNTSWAGIFEWPELLLAMSWKALQISINSFLLRLNFAQQMKLRISSLIQHRQK